MRRLKALAIGVVSGLVGLFGAGAVAALCADWYRVPSMEGQSGYFVIFIALLGLVAGLLIGVIAGALLLKRGFWLALGLVAGGMIVLLVVITGFAWVAADLPPKTQGKELTLEFEIRFPTGFGLTEGEKDVTRAYVSVTRDHGDRAQRMGPLDFAGGREENGFLVVPASIFLHTSDPGKALSIHIGERPTQFYRLPLPGKPTRSDMEWSAWLPGPTFGELEKIPAAQRLPVRYRVQFYVPPPPPPTQAQVDAEKEAADAAALALLSPEAPISEWLKFTDGSHAQAVREKAATEIAKRPGFIPEISEHVRSENREQSERAMRAISLLKTPPDSLAPALAEAATRIVDEIKEVSAHPVDTDPGYERAAAASTWFYAWHAAACPLQRTGGGGFFLPAMREIEAAAAVRTDSVTMQDVARSARAHLERAHVSPTPPATAAPTT